MSQVIAITRNMGLAERFWSLARGMHGTGRTNSPVACVRHVLAVLDALARDEVGADLSVATVSFLALLRESQQRGDVSYASPEQLRGETMDERSLVFSVGVLLFERLTGRHPFGAENNTNRQLARIQKGELGSGVNYFPSVPAALRSVLMRAMGPFPEERYRTLSDLRDQLEEFVSSQQDAGPRLPGTSARAVESGRGARRQATRVVRMATDFGRDLMEAAEPTEEREARLQKRRRDRVSQMHLRTVGRAETEPGALERRQPAIVRRSREELRPAMSVLPTMPSEPASAPKPALEPEAAAPASVLCAVGSASMSMTHESASDVADDVVSEMRSVDETPELAAELAETAPPSAAPTPVKAPTVAPTAAGNGLLGRLMWLAIGAALAAGIALFLSNRSSAPATDGAAPPPTAPATPAALAVPQPVPESEEEAEPVAFAPEAVSQVAAERAGSCFSEERLATGVRFRAGLRFAANDSGVSRVYFATSENIDSDEQSCVRDQLLGLVAVGAPETARVVDYQFRLSGSALGARVK